MNGPEAVNARPRDGFADTATTFAAVLRDAARRLGAAGIAQPRLDARVLLGHVLGVGAETMVGYPERLVTAAQRAEFGRLVARRAAREPVSRLIGRREFWSLSFMVGPDSFDPRPETETLVEGVIAETGDRSAALSILDLGTGSGCILVTLLHEFEGATGLGIDASAGALKIAAANAGALGVLSRARFAIGDWGRDIDDRFDVIVSNPPYIAAADIDGLEPEVTRFDPPRALIGGGDGLAAFRVLIPDAARLLTPGGLLALEIAAGQAAAVDTLLRGHDLTPIGRRRDLAGIERCIFARARDK